MLAELESKFQELERKLTDTLAYMDQCSASELDNKSEGQWSAVDILFHLSKSEIGSTLYLQKKMRANKEDVPNGGLGAKLRSKLLLTALKNEKRKYKAPKVIADMSNVPDYTSIKRDILNNRKALATVLGQFDATMSKKNYFKHPFAGRMNIFQTMDFLNMHFARHAVQIRERSKA